MQNWLAGSFNSDCQIKSPSFGKYAETTVHILYVGWLREHFLKLYWCKKFFYKMDLKCLEKIDKAYSRPGEIPPQAIQKNGNK